MKLMLNGPWQAQCLKNGQCEFTFTGQVPGCVHTDLAGSRLPAELQYGANADQCQWVEGCDWVYSRSFTLEAVPPNARLVFEGLDTYATVILNGHILGQTDNMHICHSFLAEPWLQVGQNTLTVRLDSPIRRTAGLPERRAAFSNYERLYTRRIQCTYGWDWVARFVTCGIYKDVYLLSETGLRLDNAYVYTLLADERGAQIVVEASFLDYEQGGTVALEIFDPEGQTVYSHSYFRRESDLKVHIDLPGARLWYPAGLGEQPMYTLRICGRDIPFGIRTVAVRQLPDAPGSPYHQLCLELKNTPGAQKYDQNTQFSGFLLTVNGLDVMCKGANWVPCEPFPSAETPQKITTLLELAREAGLNMLRVWGGGIFEQPHFYEECDRLGILVTQDFLMACGAYPEDQPEFLEAVRREAEYAALTLRNHPCLVWWSGDNENAVLGDDEARDYRGRTVIHQSIQPVLQRLDPMRRFFLSSPFGGKTYASKTVGTTHNTQYLGRECFPFVMTTDMHDYKEHFATYLARFIAEEPTTGAVCLPSLRRFMTDEEIFNGEEMWQYHTKSNPALSFSLFDFLQTFAKKVLGDFRDGHDRFFKLKYAQYEWLRVSMESVRRNRGFTNGIIYWMWNDCWAASSGWSFVDYYCLPKASYYSFKRCAGQKLVSIHRTEGFEVSVCNDSLQPQTAHLTVYALADGVLTELTQTQCTVPAATSACVLQLPLTVLPEGGMLLCDARFAEGTDRAFYRQGLLPIIPAEVTVTQRTDSAITLTAPGYVHAVELEGEYIFADNYFSLVPGETRTVTFRPTADQKDPGLTVTAYTVDTGKEQA